MRDYTRRLAATALSIACVLAFACVAVAASAEVPRIPAAPGRLVLEEGLRDGAWAAALSIDRFVEYFPGDGAPARIGTIAYFIHDDESLLVAFHLQDPDISQLRSPIVERDAVDIDQDFIDFEVDTLGQKRTSRTYRVNARGVQTDSVFTESTGSIDFSPDFPFDVATRISADGWAVAMRIPLHSLPVSRTSSAEPWRVMLYRNFPRDYRYQFTSQRVPRGSTCWLCHAASIQGPSIPAKSDLSVTPFTSAAGRDPVDGDGAVDATGGADVRWRTPRATFVDITANPDFSQIEADAPRIEANERFALQYPEKRPFFLEGAGLYSTPITAIQTRAVTDLAWGIRVATSIGTGSGSLVVAHDDGGGSVVIPGPTESQTARQDFQSLIAIGRWRQSVAAKSTVGFLGTSRIIDGGGSNLVAGPDLDWRPTGVDQITAQLLVSSTDEPSRTDLFAGWDGERLTGHALDTTWYRSTERWFGGAGYKDFDADFRADTGYVPRTGHRQVTANLGRRFFPEGVITAVHTIFEGERSERLEGGLLTEDLALGVRFQGKWGMAGEVNLHPRSSLPSGSGVARISHAEVGVRTQPSHLVPRAGFTLRIGEDVILREDRVGDSSELHAWVALQTTDYARTELNWESRRLDRKPGDGDALRKVHRADAASLKAILAPNVRSTFRLNVRYERIRSWSRDAAPDAEEQSGYLDASVLLTYRLNWRTVAYLGYGSEELVESSGSYGPAAKQAFVKVSYEFRYAR